MTALQKLVPEEVTGLMVFPNCTLQQWYSTSMKMLTAVTLQPGSYDFSTSSGQGPPTVFQTVYDGP